MSTVGNNTYQLLKSGAVSATALALAFTGAQAQQAQETFDIEAQELSKALLEFSEQSNIVVSAPTQLVRGKTAPSVKGDMSPNAALERLLQESGLKYTIADDGGVRITQAALQEEARAPQPFRVAQAAEESDAAVETVRERTGETEEDVRDEIVVTGTNIRGVSNVPSPLTVIDRAEISKTGLATVEQVIGTLTQNLDSSINNANNLAGAGGGFSTAGVNLRGLGANATLTLLNGRRLAPSGTVADFVDISLIPLSAVERIEVLSDGASAIYGSDAIGGVVNFVLRDDFDGAETNFRFGGVTEGSSQEYQASQLLGKSWGKGNFLVNYEFYRRNALDSNSRDVSVDASDPNDLVPQQERHSVFLAGRLDVTDKVELFGDGFFSTRDTETTRSVGVSSLDVNSTAEQLGIALGAKVDLSNSWQATLSGAFNSNEIDDTTLVRATGEQQQLLDQTTDVWAVDFLANGDLFALPGGAVKAAIGAQFRSEDFASFTTFPRFPTFPDFVVDRERDVYSVSGELFIPIVGDTNAMAGVNALELTIAGRLDDYSDFGSTFNPKFGVSWMPADDLRIRGTYGTSFRAPSLVQLGVAQSASVFPGFFFAPAPGSATPNPAAILTSGGNPDLNAEEADSFSLGLDFEPQAIPSLSVSLTYYEIDFDNRISIPFTTTEALSAFANPSALGDFFLFPAEQSLIDGLIANPATQNPFGVAAADVEAIILNTFQNSEATEVNGLDINLNYTRETAIGELAVGLNSSFIFDFATQRTPFSEQVDLLNSVNRPVDFRSRGSVGWSQGGATATVFVNYVDGYSADLPAPDTPVDSWTTIDATLSYAFNNKQSRGLMNDLRLSVNVINLFNEEPPFVQNARADFGINFDGNNANALGRSVFVQLTKNW